MECHELLFARDRPRGAESGDIPVGNRSSRLRGVACSMCALAVWMGVYSVSLTWENR